MRYISCTTDYCDRQTDRWTDRWTDRHTDCKIQYLHTQIYTTNYAMHICILNTYTTQNNNRQHTLLRTTIVKLFSCKTQSTYITHSNYTQSTSQFPQRGRQRDRHTDRQTDRHTHRTTTITLQCMCRGLIILTMAYGYQSFICYL